jgi:homoaconitase/3-isopropylmalate dehydratase large subunit
MILSGKALLTQIMVEKGQRLARHNREAPIRANTYGAVGAVGNAISVSDAAVAMATGKSLVPRPESVKFHVHGKWQHGVFARI